MLLAGDIGGTKTNLAIYSPERHEWLVTNGTGAPGVYSLAS